MKAEKAKEITLNSLGSGISETEEMEYKQVIGSIAHAASNKYFSAEFLFKIKEVVLAKLIDDGYVIETITKTIRSRIGNVELFVGYKIIWG